MFRRLAFPLVFGLAATSSAYDVNFWLEATVVDVGAWEDIFDGTVERPADIPSLFDAANARYRPTIGGTFSAVGSYQRTPFSSGGGEALFRLDAVISASGALEYQPGSRLLTSVGAGGEFAAIQWFTAAGDDNGVLYYDQALKIDVPSGTLSEAVAPQSLENVFKQRTGYTFALTKTWTLWGGSEFGDQQFYVPVLRQTITYRVDSLKSAEAVPEPASMMVLGLGAAAILRRVRKT